MQINTSKKPKIEVAKALSKALQKHKNSNVLLLLAGGSALQVLDIVDSNFINEYTTIMMMDERFSADSNINNYIQMTELEFYKNAKQNGAHFITSVPQINELHEQFSTRILNKLTTYLKEHSSVTTIALFGIGADGHTAAIFPMGMSNFIDTYAQGQLYVPVFYNKNEFTRRTTITPKFINKYITTSFVYAVGEEKTSILQSFETPAELHVTPASVHTRIQSILYTDISLKNKMSSLVPVLLLLFGVGLFGTSAVMLQGQNGNMASVISVVQETDKECFGTNKEKRTLLANYNSEISSTKYNKDDQTYHLNVGTCD